MADIVVSVGSSPVINTMNGDEYQIYKILENIEEQLLSKVDKVAGKGLSTNDYTTEEKTKLSELPSKTELDTDLSGKEDTANKVTTLDSNGTDTQYPSAKAVYDELVKKLNADEAVGKKTEQDGEVFNYNNNVASGPQSHAEGFSTTASGDISHTEGAYTTASGACSHSEGESTTASGACSHSEGDSSTASGLNSHAEGFGTTASGNWQHVQGKCNKEDTASKYAHIVGNGTSDSDRSNAHTLDWNGNAWYQGDIRVGGTSYDDGKTVETKTTIIKSTETTASITLADNTEFIFTEELEELEIALPQTATEPYICSVVFNSGETPTDVVYATGSIYFKGINCTGSTFTPTANKHYTLMLVYDSMELICYVSAKPIHEIILFSTADTDEASVMSDESTAEETESVTEEPKNVMETSESVAEEPESEPNEVI